MDCKNIVVVLALGLIVAAVICNCYSSKEKYGNVFYNEGLNRNILSRPSFNSNLDPRNPNNRFDPNVYGGYLKGSAPDQNNLATYNKAKGEIIDDSNVTFKPLDSQQSNGEINKPVASDFANLVDETKKYSINKYKSSLHNLNPDTLKYTTPQELLPAPDMRQPLMRDPSDPSNFMYDRTIFAPLKKRNPNEGDRFRGDLDIEPIKTGWFDIATVPTVDLVKGYFGYYNDIQEYQDVQDLSYARARDKATGVPDTAVTQKLTASARGATEGIVKPSLKYASPPPLHFGPLSNKNINPWYNDYSGVSKRDFEL